MQINFFTWLREGVKQSVLLGVSDAVEHIGLPPEREDSSQQLLEFLRDHERLADNSRKRGSGQTKQKRLGRSLKEIDAEK